MLCVRDGDVPSVREDASCSREKAGRLLIARCRQRLPLRPRIHWRKKMMGIHAMRTPAGGLAASRRRCASRGLRALVGLGALALLAPVLALAAPTADQQSALIAHGNYIVHKVGMCVDCHTPRDAHGQPIAAEDLHGATLDATPNHPVPGWAPRSVKIAGLPAGYTEAQLVTFLETGNTPRGTMASPPMPNYRLDEHDARAVAAYLHSIN
jgi:cytochrome c553